MVRLNGKDSLCSLCQQASYKPGAYSLCHRALRSVWPATSAPGSPVGAARVIYLGDDARGIALEVMAVELESGDLLVIHAMRLREKYRREYEEAKKWRT